MKYLLLISLFFSYGCRTSNYTNFDYERSKTPYINAFKDRVFFSALREAYKTDPTIFVSIEKRDALNPYDGLSLEDMEMAIQLGTNLVKKMPPPAMCEDCAEGENYYMANALHYYNSKELEDIARRRYKIWEKENKKYRLSKD